MCWMAASMKCLLNKHIEREERVVYTEWRAFTMNQGKIRKRGINHLLVVLCMTAMRSYRAGLL